MAENDVLKYDYDKAWDYENGFYLTSHPKRLSKALAHFELYKKITHLPGHVLEFGVFKGTSLIRFLSFRDILESSFSRKVIGFDAFGKFPVAGDEHDVKFIKKFESAGGEGIPVAQLEEALARKGQSNFELIEGDIFVTLPDYLEQHPELKIALLHIDVDVYDPSKFVLEKLYERVVPGGVIIFDDYATVAGETRAVDEFLAGKGQSIQKLSISHIPAYAQKV